MRVLESRPFLGGRATSYEIGTGEDAETIDNCQHILLRCCVNLLDFYRRLGVENDIAFLPRVHFHRAGRAAQRAARRHAAGAGAFRRIVPEAEFLNLS